MAAVMAAVPTTDGREAPDETADVHELREQLRAARSQVASLQADIVALRRRQMATTLELMALREALRAPAAAARETSGLVAANLSTVSPGRQTAGIEQGNDEDADERQEHVRPNCR